MHSISKRVVPRLSKKQSVTFKKASSSMSTPLNDDIINILAKSSITMSNGKNMFHFFLEIMDKLDMKNIESVSRELQKLINLTYGFLKENLVGVNRSSLEIQSFSSGGSSRKRLNMKKKQNVQAAYKFIHMLLYLNGILFLKDVQNKDIHRIINEIIINDRLFDESPKNMMENIIRSSTGMIPDSASEILSPIRGFNSSQLLSMIDKSDSSVSSSDLNDLLMNSKFYSDLHSSIHGKSKDTTRKESNKFGFFGNEGMTPFQMHVSKNIFPILILYIANATNVFDKMNSGRTRKGGGLIKGGLIKGGMPQFYGWLVPLLGFALSGYAVQGLNPEDSFKGPKSKLKPLTKENLLQVIYKEWDVTKKSLGYESQGMREFVQNYIPRSNTPIESRQTSFIAGGIASAVVIGTGLFAIPAAISVLGTTGTWMAGGLSASYIWNSIWVGAGTWAGSSVWYTNEREDTLTWSAEEQAKLIEEIIADMDRNIVKFEAEQIRKKKQQLDKIINIKKKRPWLSAFAYKVIMATEYNPLSDNTRSLQMLGRPQGTSFYGYDKDGFNDFTSDELRRPQADRHSDFFNQSNFKPWHNDIPSSTRFNTSTLNHRPKLTKIEEKIIELEIYLSDILDMLDLTNVSILSMISILFFIIMNRIYNIIKNRRQLISANPAFSMAQSVVSIDNARQRQNAKMELFMSHANMDATQNFDTMPIEELIILSAPIFNILDGIGQPIDQERRLDLINRLILIIEKMSDNNDGNKIDDDKFHYIDAVLKTIIRLWITELKPSQKRSIKKIIKRIRILPHHNDYLPIVDNEEIQKEISEMFHRKGNY